MIKRYIVEGYELNLKESVSGDLCKSSDVETLEKENEELKQKAQAWDELEKYISGQKYMSCYLPNEYKLFEDLHKEMQSIEKEIENG